MEFKEYSEYLNPEETDYDIKSSLHAGDNSIKEKQNNDLKQPTSIYKKVFTRLYVELGCPEYEELEQFGITLQEIDNPTKETFAKLKKYAEHYQLKVSREAAEEIRGYYQTNGNGRNR